MQVAKATPEDIKATFNVNNILELLQSNQMPEDWLEETDGDDWFDQRSDSQCAMAMRKMLETINTGAMFRVAMGMSVLTDPVNKLIDPDSDVLEFHPEIKALQSEIEVIKANLEQSRLINAKSATAFSDLNSTAYHQNVMCQKHYWKDKCQCRECVDGRVKEITNSLMAQEKPVCAP